MKTKAELLAYLTALPTGSSKRLLSGQRCDYLNDPLGYGSDWDGGDQWALIGANSGGVFPAIMGVDVDPYYYGIANDYDVDRVVNHWNAGGLVFVDWFATNPDSANNGTTWAWPLRLPVITSLPNVYTPGNSTYDHFRTAMVHVADLFQTLEDNGVVVLFRPFAEMDNGGCNQSAGGSGWNWWGARDYNEFKALWTYVHDYFTNTRGLSNILWVYGVNEGSACTTNYYPGSSYVDFVGVSFYNEHGENDIYWIAEYDSLRALGKPFVLSELGQVDWDADMDEASANKDTRLIPSGIRSNMPEAVWWMNWGDSWQLGRGAYLSSMFADTWVINRADNPSGALVEGSSPTITTTTLPAGEVGYPYDQTLAATGGVGTLEWSVVSGALPGGLSLSADGHITGDPTTIENPSFTVRVTDANGDYDEQALSINVVASTGYQTWTAEVAGADVIDLLITHLQLTDQLIAGQIAAGAIGADEIAANVIAAKHLIVADFSNMLLNPAFTGGLSDKWSLGGGAAIRAKGYSGVPSGAPNDYVAELDGVNSNITQNWYDVNPGEDYYCSYRGAIGAGTATAIGPYCYVEHQDASITGVGFTGADLAGSSVGWTFCSGRAVMPSTAKRFGFVVQRRNAAGAKVYVANLRLRKAVDASLIVDGSVTARTVGANEIIAQSANIANAIIGGVKLENGAVTLDKLAFNNLAGLNPDEGSKLTGISPLADVTSANTAAAIAGQGALATKSTADYASDVSGTKPPTNADVTLEAIQGLLSITGGGIKLDAGGVLKGGKNSYDDGAAGFFLGYQNALYKFYVGTATRFFKFDGSNGVTVGGDVIITGNLVANAVTTPISAYAVGPISPAVYSASPIAVISSSIISTGAPIRVTAGFLGYSGNWYRLLIYRGATLLYDTGDVSTGFIGGTNTPIVAAIEDIPGAGTYIYYIYAQTDISGGRIKNVSMLLMEVKR